MALLIINLGVRMINSSLDGKGSNELSRLMTNLVEVAKWDLKAAKVLYAHKLYPHAVFYAEQCAEKAAKSSLVFCLHRKMQVASLIQKDQEHEDTRESSVRATGSEDVVKRLKDVSHDVRRLTGELCACLEKVMSDLSNYLQTFEDKYRDVLEVKRLEGLEIILNLFKKRSEEIGNMCQPIISWDDQKLIRLSQDEHILLKYLSDIEGTYRDYKEAEPLIYMLEALIKLIAPTQTSDLMGDLVQGATVGVRGVLSLGLLIILSPHVSRSRYPDIEFNPLDEYTEDLPLIRHFNRVLKLLEDAFKIAETR